VGCLSFLLVNLLQRNRVYVGAAKSPTENKTKNMKIMAIDFKLLMALKRARNVHGDRELIDHAIEEMGELIVAINHYRRGRVEVGAVQEEIADVMLAMKELQQIYGAGKTADIYLAKCEKFKRKIEELFKNQKAEP